MCASSSSSKAESCDIAIVGAGAAGLGAAIFAASSSAPRRILLLDGARSIGAKILVSGGGRCNVTHDVVGPDDYNGSRNIVRNVLAAFPVEATIEWFRDLGVELKREDTGKLFPVSDRARTVLDALLGRCARLGVDIRPGCRVSDITPLPGGGFAVHHEEGTIRAGRVILATGGRSLPKTGSDGLGWEMVRRLGHSVTETYPALVPLVLQPGFFHADLSGLSCHVELATFADGRRLDRRRGELLWTHFGISGPVVMDASRHWVIARATGRRTELLCSFLPGWDFEQTERWLMEQAAEHPAWSIGRVLEQKFPERLAGALAGSAGVAPSASAGQVPRELRRRLVHALTALPLPVMQDRGWNYAEVTAGGVPLNEIDYRTLASRRVPGLYLVGEMLDCDGRIGGFNFQWAWATGYLAGRAAVI